MKRSTKFDKSIISTEGVVTSDCRLVGEGQLETGERCDLLCNQLLPAGQPFRVVGLDYGWLLQVIPIQPSDSHFHNHLI